VLYGRDAERTAIGALLDRARASRSGALVVRGEAGIGKTALLEDARERATDMHVLSVRGVESERELPFAGLHQLVRPALGLLDELPAPQARALRGALGLSERSGDDRFLISAACLSLLSELAEKRPVLCLVDDAHWLDTPSVDALLFVARRIDAEGIVMLIAAREAEETRFEARALPDLFVGGLEPDAAERLLTSAGERMIAPAVREALVRQADGNALALVELPGALSDPQLAGSEALPDTLPLTRDLGRLYLDRVQRLPHDAQQLLLLIAADDTNRLGPVLRAAEALGIAEGALQSAEHSGLVVVAGTRVDVRHPLIRSAVYQGVASSDRRRAHLALALALDDDEYADQRAWHRAAAAVDEAADVAEELERTAERARLRSGHAAAGTALERAAALSPDSESRGRRLVAAATAAWHAGQAQRASTLVERASPLVSEPHLRASLEHVRGEIQLRCGGLVEACDILMQGAAAIAPLDARKALEMLLAAREAAGWAGDTPRTVESGRRAAELPRSDDAEYAFLADLLVGVGSLYEGDAAMGTPMVQAVVAQAESISEPSWLAWAGAGARAIGDEAGEARLLQRAVVLARQSGAVDKLTYVLMASALMGVLDGRPAGEVEAAEGLALGREAGLTNAVSTHLAMLAWFAALRGAEEECRAYASEANELATTRGAVFSSSIADWAIGLLELSRRQPEAAADRLAGIDHPYFALASAPDLVEASVRADRREGARAAAALFSGFSQSDAPVWAQALAARCRALLATDSKSDAAFAEALDLHAKSDRPFDSARTKLLHGEHLRRVRRRSDARVQLRAALDEFEALDMATWAERARVELRASGETARRRDPSTMSQLTPQELQVARLVSEGLSNKEVAAHLFLSPRTIDAHLRNVFAKLGLTSRMQLARLQFDSATAGADLVTAAATA
jgi:DNA-binding NarL/FixJ family response regulator